MLRYSDIGKMYRVLGRCIEARMDPEAWRLSLAYDLRDLFGAPIVQVGEFRHIHDDARAELLHHLDIGWPSPEQQGHFIAYQIEGAHRDDPMRHEITRRKPRLLATSASALLDFDAYRETEVFRRYMAPAGTGDILVGIGAIAGSGGERWHLMSCTRLAGQPLFSPYDRRLLRVMMLELMPLIGEQLADSTSPLMSLTPRQRHVLRLLLAGLPETRAAQEIGVSPPTLHKYVTELYRHFAVNSRAELQARFGMAAISDHTERARDPRHARVRREGAPMAGPWRNPTTFTLSIKRAGRAS